MAQYLANVGSTQTTDGNIRTTALAYDAMGNYLGVWCGKAILPCPLPRSFVRAGGSDWQVATTTASGLLLWSYPYPARDAKHAWRNFLAMRAQSLEMRA